MENTPLKGIRIVDFGWILSVPHCCSWLGTFGAEVIRIESNKSIDMVRMMGPADGIAGLRVNHNLHVKASPVSITPP